MRLTNTTPSQRSRSTSKISHQNTGLLIKSAKSTKPLLLMMSDKMVGIFQKKISGSKRQPAPAKTQPALTAADSQGQQRLNKLFAVQDQLEEKKVTVRQLQDRAKDIRNMQQEFIEKKAASAAGLRVRLGLKNCPPKQSAVKSIRNQVLLGLQKQPTPRAKKAYLNSAQKQIAALPDTSLPQNQKALLDKMLNIIKEHTAVSKGSPDLRKSVS